MVDLVSEFNVYGLLILAPSNESPSVDQAPLKNSQQFTPSPQVVYMRIETTMYRVFSGFWVHR